MKRVNSWCLLVDKYGDNKGEPVALCYGIDSDHGSNGEWGIGSTARFLPRWIKTVKHLQHIFQLPITGYTISHRYNQYDVILLGVMEYREITRLLDLVPQQVYADLNEVGAWITTPDMVDERIVALQRTIEIMANTINVLKDENAELNKTIDLVKCRLGVTPQSGCDGNCDQCSIGSCSEGMQ